MIPLLLPSRSKTALRGALWVLTHSTTLPHRAKRKVEAVAAPAARAAQPRAPWGPQRDARAAWQTWWTHWNNARWKSWSRTSQKVSDERGHLCGQMCDLQLLAISLAPCRSFITFCCLSLFFFLSVLFSSRLYQSLSLSPSVMNPCTFRWEGSLCFSSTQTDSISCLGLLSAMLCIFITTWQMRCMRACVCSVYLRVQKASKHPWIP